MSPRSATELAITLCRAGTTQEVHGRLTMYFEDEKLQQFYMSRLNGSGILTANVNDERPPKKARLSDRKDAVQPHSTLQSLKDELCRLFSPEKPCAFAELHHIAA